MRQLRILFLTGALPPIVCGVGDYTSRLIDAIYRTGQATIGVATSIEGFSPNPIPGVQVLALHGWKYRHLGSFARVLCSWRPHIVHTQFPTQGITGPLYWLAIIYASWVMRIRCVITLHETPQPSAVASLALWAASEVIRVRSNLKLSYRPGSQKLLAHRSSVVIPIGSNIPKVAVSQERADRVRNLLGVGQRRLLVSFGILYPEHGFEELLNIADPEKDFIVIAGGRCPSCPEYYDTIALRLSDEAWLRRSAFLGHLPAQDIAELLAVADAVILPYLSGSHEGKGAILAARMQGTFIITTHASRRGYIPDEHTYYTQANDTTGMKAALNSYSGIKAEAEAIHCPTWDSIAQSHLRLYRQWFPWA
jgi:glycosyltransferase involved in cell wall biosynthesis